MRIFLKVLLLCCCTFTAAHAQGWKGIVPLHSTRADVERLLGPGECDSSCHYDFEGDRINVDYAKAPCEGNPSGWNVPVDTVLKLSVSSERERQFSELGLDESKYEKDYDDASFIYYSSRERGVQYTVFQGSGLSGIKNVIHDTTYVPSSKDSRLRCPCFAADDLSIFKTRPVDEFTELSFKDSRARLDNLAIKLTEVPEWKGFVMVYAARQTSPAMARSYVRRSREYMVGYRALPPEKVTAMYGGYRDYFHVELFIYSHEIAPPKPRPYYVPCGSRQTRSNGRRVPKLPPNSTAPPRRA